MTFKDKIESFDKAGHVELRCGRCIGCRLTKARDWAVRINHEASLHQENSFITLTYDPEHLPEYGSIDYDHWKKFMYRLRKHCRYHHEKEIRFYMCGEYGTDKSQHADLGRPHFHAIIFGHAFTDDRVFFKMRDGHKTYVSESLARTWGKGHSEIGSVTMESAGYVAGYVTKKITGEAANDHYMRVDQDTGECFPIEHEKARMSRNPGIGKGWYEAFAQDLEKGFITVGGKETSIPQFYKRVLEQRQPDIADRIQAEGETKRLKQDRWNLQAEERQTHAKQKERML